MRNWQPITLRNRVALWLAFGALVMFVSWNLLPMNYEGLFEGVAAKNIWPVVFSPDFYLSTYHTGDFYNFLSIGVFMALILHGLVVITILPLWKILHASNYVRIPLAIMNLIAGSLIMWFLIRGIQYAPPINLVSIVVLIALSMFFLSAALFIFKNELGLRNDLEVEKRIVGSDAR